MQTVAKDYELEILKRVILAEQQTMSRALAEEILQYRFSETDHERMSVLAAKARAGTLTPDEYAEAVGYEKVGSLLGCLKSKARVALRQSPAE